MVKKYIVKNCPAYTANGGYYDCWCNQDTWCKNVDDCLMKRIIDEASTLYREPEYFETLEDNEEQYLIESAWHNAAHIVMSKVDIEEIEE